jgi:hypothetical protein
MMQNSCFTASDLALIGEEIGYELGHQMVTDYQNSHPADVKSYIVGRQIIDRILAQPGCVGIKFLNAYNEMGQKTLVYIGLDAAGNNILEYSCINVNGELVEEKGIVADRVRIPGTSVKTGLEGGEDWGWAID